jgi:Flp pilus assembly protein TadG
MLLFIHIFTMIAQNVKQRFCDQSGVAAIEFAFVGPIFLFFIICFIEIGLTNLTELDMSIALDKAARQLVVSQDNSGALASADAFKTAFCKDINLIPNCKKSINLFLQARVFPGDLFAGQDSGLNDALNVEWNTKQKNQQQLPWCMGLPGSQIFLELEYLAPVYVTGWFVVGVAKNDGAGDGRKIVRPIKIRSLYVREPISAVLAKDATPPKCP